MAKRPDAPKEEDRTRHDEYLGQYKDAALTASQEEQWGLSENPVKETPTPYKGLKAVTGQG